MAAVALFLDTLSDQPMHQQAKAKTLLMDGSNAHHRAICPESKRGVL
jgi:hypothetical protein